MTRIIAIASGKGGVGKTTLVSNISAALASYGKSVVAIDGNLTTSNLGIHLGIPLYPITLQDVLRGDALLKDSMYYHHAGFRVVPADVSLSKLMLPSAKKMVDVFYKLAGDADFVLIDSAAGLGREAVSTIRAADEMITVTNPEMPAVTDAIKLVQVAEHFGTHNIGIILNRVKNRQHEMRAEEIESLVGSNIIGKVHEDPNVPVSIAKRQPLMLHNPKSIAAQQIRSIAAGLVGEEYKVRVPVSNMFFSWLRK